MVESQYRSVIFYQDAEQEHLAWASKVRLEKSGRFEDQIVTEIVAATVSYTAEEYHSGLLHEEPVPLPGLPFRLRAASCGSNSSGGSRPDRTDAPRCQDTPSGGLDDLLTSAEVGHDALVNLSREEAFQAADDVAFGPASGEASGDVVAGRLVEWHPDDDGSIEGRVGVSVAASIEAVPTGGHPRRGRDRAGAAELREGGLRTNPVGVIAEDDQQLSRGVGAHTEALAEGR